MFIVENKLPLAHLLEEPAELVRAARQSGEPIVLEQPGEAEIVLLSGEAYRELLLAAERAIEVGIDAPIAPVHREGVQTTEEVFSVLRKKFERTAA